MNNQFTRRCDQAIKDLENFAENRKDDRQESVRLFGKIEGVKLAKNYAEQEFEEVMEFLNKMNDWLENNNEIFSNSVAHVELDKILEKLK